MFSTRLEHTTIRHTAATFTDSGPVGYPLAGGGTRQLIASRGGGVLYEDRLSYCDTWCSLSDLVQCTAPLQRNCRPVGKSLRCIVGALSAASRGNWLLYGTHYFDLISIRPAQGTNTVMNNKLDG